MPSMPVRRPSRPAGQTLHRRVGGVRVRIRTVLLLSHNEFSGFIALCASLDALKRGCQRLGGN